ncbi:hypothetical protein RE628_22275 [Paenibacillus sp. D2_2]|nr:hypothetical protein [Paenibacillus sp. D2_2]WMT40027.1 hypothetical protein RE628_22275 [Paenibacillus sp. D2_2]
MMIVLPPGDAGKIGQMNLTGLEQQILRMKQDSAVQYRYDSIADLQFELATRAKIVEAARDLYNSGADFATFENSRGNPNYWVRLSNGDSNCAVMSRQRMQSATFFRMATNMLSNVLLLW